VRKSGAILLLLLFVFAQYAKQVSYLKCELSVAIGTESQTCDCVKAAGLDKADNQATSPGHVHHKISTEELFHTTGSITLQRHWMDCTAIYSRTGLVKIPEGLLPAPWRPPCSRAVYYST